MTTEIRKYSEIDLQLSMDSQIKYPEKITELDFYHQIQRNTRLRWRVNPTVTEEKCLRILLDPSNFNKWTASQWFPRIVGAFVAYWGLLIWTPEMLILLAVLPFAVIPIPQFLFTIFMGLVIFFKIQFLLAIPLFWVIMIMITISFAVVKTADDIASRFILNEAFKDWETFWRYYSLQIIYPRWELNPLEFKTLLDRYPELQLASK